MNAKKSAAIAACVFRGPFRFFPAADGFVSLAKFPNGLPAQRRRFRGSFGSAIRSHLKFGQ